ncbi:glycosyltransferase [Marimonas sp. MJW-29]|uniref:Glycosyltransferase n=1 Tax=Sulfitobacter sediminis TaxID=3234186 RepID=A0ABV3RP43_9RHOB
MPVLNDPLSQALPPQPMRRWKVSMLDQVARKRALLMCLGDASWSPRTIRFARHLRECGYHITVASKPFTREFECDSHIALCPAPRPKNLLTRRLPGYAYFGAFLPSDALKDAINTYRHGLRGLGATLAARTFDLILVQDLALLPVALRQKKDARVIFDAREYYPAQNEEDRRFRVFEKPERNRLCARDLPRCDHVITVSRGLADAYAQNFGVSPTVIHSASAFHDVKPSPVAPSKIRLVYHGVANRNRGLANLFKLMERLRPEFTLDLYLVTKDKERLDEIQAMAKPDDRITLHPPVPYDRIVEEMNQYDIGVIYYEPTSFNLKHCMPNKLFEYIQARLAVAVGPSPDMATFLLEKGCGVISDQFSIESLAEALNTLRPEDLAALKRHSANAALTASLEKELELFDSLLT